jgi:hypothetical protein
MTTTIVCEKARCKNVAEFEVEYVDKDGNVSLMFVCGKHIPTDFLVVSMIPDGA